MGKEKNQKTLFWVKVEVEASTGTLQLGQQAKIIRIEVIFWEHLIKKYFSNPTQKMLGAGCEFQLHE